MGQKIHPTGFRLSVNRNWTSRWYANSKNFPAMLNEDIKVREYLGKKLEAREMKLAIIALLVHPFLILGGTALFAATPPKGSPTMPKRALPGVKRMPSIESVRLPLK